MTRLLINAGDSEEVRVALVENKELVEFLVERADAQELIGNIYLAKLARIDKRHEAAFVDFGMEKDGFVPCYTIGSVTESIHEIIIMMRQTLTSDNIDI